MFHRRIDHKAIYVILSPGVAGKAEGGSCLRIQSTHPRPTVNRRDSSLGTYSL